MSSDKYSKKIKEICERNNITEDRFNESWSRNSSRYCYVCQDDKDLSLGIPIEFSLHGDESITIDPSESLTPDVTVKPRLTSSEKIQYLNFRTPLKPYLCLNCRTTATMGGEVIQKGGDKLILKSIADRGFTGKFADMNFELMRYKDDHGNQWRVCDRLSTVYPLCTNQCEDYQLQQLSIMMGFPGDELLNYRRLTGTFETTMADAVCQILMPLTRNLLIENIGLSDEKIILLIDRLIEVLSIGLYFSGKYPLIKKEIQKKLFIWNFNPFNDAGLNAVYHYLDIPFLGLLSDFYSKSYANSEILHLCVEILSSIEDKLMDKLNDRMTNDTVIKQWVEKLWQNKNTQNMVQTVFLGRLVTNYLLSFRTINDCLKHLSVHGFKIPQKDIHKIYREFELFNELSVVDQINGLFDIKTEKEFFIKLLKVKSNLGGWCVNTEQCKITCFTERNNRGGYFVVNNTIDTKDLSREEITQKLNHQGYPELDSIKGRPHMGFCVCYHQNCGQSFRSGLDLRQHLQIHKTDFYDKLHYSHEKLSITVEQVLSGKYKKCPSLICDQHNRIFTPEELIVHFQALGVKPFWSEGMEKPKYTHGFNKPPDEKEELLEDFHSHKKIELDSDVCFICFDNPSNIQGFPCGHICICETCLKKNYSKYTNMLFKCLICTCKVQNYSKCGVSIKLPAKLAG